MSDDQEPGTGPHKSPTEFSQPNNLVTNLRQLLKDDRLDAATLMTLHSSYTGRSIADNATIWITGAFFIPASFAAPVTYLTLSHPGWGAFVLLCAPSLILLSVWVLIAENHRALMIRSAEVASNVEEALGIELGNDRRQFERGWLPGLASRFPTRWLRRLLPAILLLGWLGLCIGKAVG
jgi:hypothetical protein